MYWFSRFFVFLSLCSLATWLIGDSDIIFLRASGLKISNPPPPPPPIVRERKMESNRSALVPLLVIIWDMIACTNKDLLLNLLAVHTLQSSQPEPGLSETITRPLYGILMEAEKQDKKKISILTRPEDGPATMLFFRP